MTTVVVGGALANKPWSAGEAWVRLSWLRGFRRLGCRGHRREQIDPAGFTAGARAHDERGPEEIGLAGAGTLIVGEDQTATGLSLDDLLDLAGEADLLANFSGNVYAPRIVDRFARKAYVDLDPGFTQMWHAAGNPGARLEGHDTYFTVGENVGVEGCSIPTDGIDGRPMPPPVVLEDWPPEDGGTSFTTVASWRGVFGPVEYAGHTYGLKVHEFRKVIELPRCVAGTQFEIALDIHPADAADREALIEHGWHLADPSEVVPGPLEFREYVQRSGAEFSVAQNIYVETWSGWFSDRTVRYLAAGKPALVQDTGFGRNHPVGEGLLAFRTLEDAVAGAQRIIEDYARHSAAARALAEERFDSDIVLPRFLEEAL